MIHLQLILGSVAIGLVMYGLIFLLIELTKGTK